MRALSLIAHKRVSLWGKGKPIIIKWALAAATPYSTQKFLVAAAISTSGAPRCSRAIATVSSLYFSRVQFAPYFVTISLPLLCMWRFSRPACRPRFSPVKCQLTGCLYSHRPDRSALSKVLPCCVVNRPTTFFLFRFLYRCNPLRPTIPSSA